jgi:CRISPR-associated protein Csx17
MPEIVLTGCRPEPLGSYLAALGVLRVATVADAGAAGCWRSDAFVLESALDRRGLGRFLLDDYRPTPLVAPWNGGSGFYPKDRKVGIDALRGATAERFATYRRIVEAVDRLFARLGIDEKVDKTGKERLIEACRSSLPDAALEWLDAAVLLTGEGPKYPPLLGTGGNDGRLEFSNNFMQRVVWLFDAGTGAARAEAAPLLAAALFDEPVDLLVSVAVGQFDPVAAGGANAASDFGGESLVNPWSYVLMLEGAVLFAAAAARRMQHDAGGSLSYPFTVRAVAAGYGSAAGADEGDSRGEIWVPLWDRPARLAEVRAVFAEGRAHVRGRPAATGVDFARAVATLGVDRGIDSFVRYGFLVRNGLSYLAAPLGRFRVRHRRPVTHLQEIDAWLDRFRSRARTGPASIARALRELEAAIIALCERGDAPRLLDVLLELGRCERALARGLRWTLEAGIPPVPALSASWLEAVDDGSVELRLAASLASVSGRYGAGEGRWQVIPLRAQLEPVVTVYPGDRLRARWLEDAGRDVVWSDGEPIEDLQRVLARRLVLTIQRPAAQADEEARVSYSDSGRLGADLADIAAFLDERVDDRRLADLLWACCLLDWPGVTGRPLRRAPGRDTLPGALYGLLKLCFAGRRVRDAAVPAVPRLHRLASAGQASAAAAAAARRLRASGLPPAVEAVHVDGREARRTAAALLFPLDAGAVEALANRFLRPREDESHRTPAVAAPTAT